MADRHDDLLEIVPSKIGDPGEHRILVVGQAKCDIEEVDFLAQETTRLLAQSARRSRLGTKIELL